METPIIKIDDILNFRQIDRQINTDNLNGHIIGAQREQLADLLGAGFYNALITTPASYIDLIEGETFTNSQGETAQYFGLKPFLVFHTLSSLLNDNNLKISDTGNDNFLDSTFQKASSGEIRDAKQDYTSTANVYRSNIIEYLDQNRSTYPLWRSKQKNNQLDFDIQIF